MSNKYISYAVKFPDTNHIGVSDLYISENDTGVEQVRGVLPITVYPLNGNSLPIGGGDSDSIKSKILDLYRLIDTAPFIDFKRITTEDISSIRDSIVQVVRDATALKDSIPNDIGDAIKYMLDTRATLTNAIYKEMRETNKLLEKRIMELEGVISNIQEDNKRIILNEVRVNESIGNLQKINSVSRLDELERLVQNIQSTLQDPSTLCTTP